MAGKFHGVFSLLLIVTALAFPSLNNMLINEILCSACYILIQTII